MLAAVGAPNLAQPRRFQTTRWSVIRAAGHKPSAHSRDALGVLCSLYWHPVYSFIRAQGRSADEARDLTQGFFADLLSRDDLAGLDPSLGRFRSWLLACVKHFLGHERERQSTQTRGGGVAPLSIDVLLAEGHYQPSHDLTPERLYERRWALTLLDQVLATVRQRYVDRGKEQLFTLLSGSLTGDDDASYKEIARVLDMNVVAVRVAAHRMRELYDELLRAAVADTVERVDEVDDEIDRLRKSLSP